MIRAFKRAAVAMALQPGRLLVVASVVLLALTICLRSMACNLAAGICAMMVLYWHKRKTAPIGVNFAVMPSMPLLDGKPYYYLFQKPRRDVKSTDCHELLTSLIQDKHMINDALPAGVYKTFTHETVLHVLEHCSRIRFIEQPKPIYTDTLQPILKSQTKNRCKSCNSPCASWTSEPRMFYSACFEVI